MSISKFDAVHALVGGQITQKTDGSFDYHDGQTQPSDEVIQSKLVELQAEYDAKQYQRNRASAYPSWQEQMDLLYHGGLDALKAELKKTKDKYPKPT